MSPSLFRTRHRLDKERISMNKGKKESLKGNCLYIRHLSRRRGGPYAADGDTPWPPILKPPQKFGGTPD